MRGWLSQIHWERDHIFSPILAIANKFSLHEHISISTSTERELFIPSMKRVFERGCTAGKWLQKQTLLRFNLSYFCVGHLRQNKHYNAGGFNVK